VRPLRVAASTGTTVLALLLPVRAQDTPVFRSSAEAITVDVSVRRGGRPVGGLAISDFTITDNGVGQKIGALVYEQQPIDTTIVFDVSGSVTGHVLDQLRRSVADLRASLRPSDRLRLIAFNTRVWRLFDVDASTTVIDRAFEAMAPEGGSAVIDALIVAFSTPSPPDRRQFIVLFSDGRDSSSVSMPDTLMNVARHTTATLSVVMAAPTPLARSSVYADVATETGGTIVSLLPTDTLGGSLRRALDQFRSSYVLTYSPTGVSRSGAHALVVTVNRPGLDVRARRGYEVP
jgi:VWFA-related protein